MNCCRALVRRVLKASIFVFENRKLRKNVSFFPVYLRSLTLVQLSAGYVLFSVSQIDFVEKN